MSPPKGSLSFFPHQIFQCGYGGRPLGPWSFFFPVGGGGGLGVGCGGGVVGLFFGIHAVLTFFFLDTGSMAFLPPFSD